MPSMISFFDMLVFSLNLVKKALKKIIFNPFWMAGTSKQNKGEKGRFLK